MKRFVSLHLLAWIVACSGQITGQLTEQLTGSCQVSAAVGLAVSMQADEFTADQISRAVQDVMQHRDFRSLRSRAGSDPDEATRSDGFLKSVGDAITRFLDWMFGSSQKGTSTGSGNWLGALGSQMLLVLAIILLIVVVILVAAVIIRTSHGRRHARAEQLFGTGDDHPTRLTVPPGELAAALYEQKALQLAGAGDFRAAIRELLLGSMSWIERGGWIRFRRGLTNRDYLRAIWRQADKRQAFSTTSNEFDRVYFGRRQATEEMFQLCLNCFRGEFREEQKVSSSG